MKDSALAGEVWQPDLLLHDWRRRLKLRKRLTSGLCAAVWLKMSKKLNKEFSSSEEDRSCSSSGLRAVPKTLKVVVCCAWVVWWHRVWLESEILWLICLAKWRISYFLTEKRKCELTFDQSSLDGSEWESHTCKIKFTLHSEGPLYPIFLVSKNLNHSLPKKKSVYKREKFFWVLIISPPHSGALNSPHPEAEASITS